MPTTHTTPAGYRLWSEGRRAEALAAMEAALALRPDFAEAHYNRGVMLQALSRQEEALAAYDRALALKPALAQAWNNRGGALAALGRFAEAVASYDRLLALSPRNASAHYNRGTALQRLGEWSKAADSFARTLPLNPGHADAFGCLASAALHLCDFGRVAALAPQLEDIVRHNRAVVAPLVFLGFSGDPAAAAPLRGEFRRRRHSPRSGDAAARSGTARAASASPICRRISRIMPPPIWRRNCSSVMTAAASRWSACRSAPPMAAPCVPASWAPSMPSTTSPR